MYALSHITPIAAVEAKCTVPLYLLLTRSVPGFDFVSLANNHTLDYHQQGLQDTVQVSDDCFSTWLITHSNGIAVSLEDSSTDLSRLRPTNELIHTSHTGT